MQKFQRRITADEARRTFAELIQAVRHRGEPVVITHYGKPWVVIAPAANEPRTRKARIVPLPGNAS